MTRDKIYGRNHLVGSGGMNHPDRLEELEELRAKHERLTRGKPVKAFGEFLDEKMGKKPKKKKGEGGEGDEDENENGQGEEKGAKDPHLGLTVGQKPSIANRSGGRRSGKVIVKG